MFTLCAGAVFSVAIRAGAPLPFQLVTGCLLAYGLYCTAGRFVYKRFDRRRTVYAVTSQRVMVVRREGRDVVSVPSSDRPTRIERGNDGMHGTMRWGTVEVPESIGSLMSMRRRSDWLSGGTYWPSLSSSSDVSFWDVKDFDELVRATRLAATGGFGDEAGRERR